MPDTATHRIFNFSAGPCTLPLPVLERARDELVDFPGDWSHLGSQTAFEGHCPPNSPPTHQAPSQPPSPLWPSLLRHSCIER